MKRTSMWKYETGQKNINFCLPHALLQELDQLKAVIGGTRSEMIRSAIRDFINLKNNTLVEQERRALEAYRLRQQNRQKHVVNTGLLPDY